MGSLPYTNPQAIFQQQFESVRRDEVVGVLLAFFLGCFGAHHFYVGRVGLGLIYCCFCWTGIPAFLGVIECFFMPGRVRAYNAVQAAGLAAAMGIGIPNWAPYPTWGAAAYQPVPAYGALTHAPVRALGPALNRDVSLLACPACGHANSAAARFCSDCGNRLL